MLTTTRDDVRIRLLGPVELVADGDDLGGPKQRLLLAVLALQAGRVVPVGDLVSALWEDDLPEDTQRSLQVHVSKLRRAMSDAGIDATIEHRGNGYVLLLADGVVDVTYFEQLVEQAASLADADPERTRELLREALDLWRGEPFGGLGSHDALRPDVARLEAMHLRALERRIACDVDLGRHAAAVAELHRLTGDHPLDEQLWAHLLLALYRSGRQGEALEAYERARHVLADELGADPSPELRDLHRRILQQDATLLDGRAEPTTSAPPDPQCVAVLPFEVIGSSPEVELLASGLHNDLLTELARSPGLTVIGRASVLGYRDSGKSGRVIADELNAGTLVHGALQSAGRRFRLTIHVVDGPTDRHRWAQTYDDEVTTENLFSIQTDLAGDIAKSLSAELVSDDGRPGPQTASLDAYRLVAAGRQQFDIKTPDSLERAIDCYEEAVRLDPDYAGAWAGLASALVSMAAYGHGDRHDLLPRAERTVHRALSLDPDAASARTSLGSLHTTHQEGPAALLEFRRAIRDLPGHADAHNWHSWVSLLVGDAASGLRSARRAAELDPRSAESHAHVALALAATGDPEGGLQAARAARRLSPYTTASLYEALCLVELGAWMQAASLLESLVADHDELAVPWAGCGPHALLTIAQAESGEDDAARRTAASIDPGRFPFAAGVGAAAVGDLEQAVKVLGRIDHLTAWPCLVVHHYLRRLWLRDELGEVHRHLGQVALRSWSMHTPSPA